jgi:hypothetical protein
MSGKYVAAANHLEIAWPLPNFRTLQCLYLHSGTIAEPLPPSRMTQREQFAALGRPLLSILIPSHQVTSIVIGSIDQASE